MASTATTPRAPKPATPAGLRNVRPRWLAGRWRWRAVLTIDGRRLVGPTRDTPQQAARDVPRIEAEAKRPAVSPVTLGEALGSVLAWQAARGQASARSRAALGSVVRAILRHLPEGAPVGSLGAFELVTYAREAQAAGRAARTIAEKDLPTLREAFRLAGAPWPHGIKPPRVPRRPMAFFRAEELAPILARLREPAPSLGAGEPAEELAGGRFLHADLLELLFLTGLRVGELARLRLGDLDPVACELRVLNHKDAGHAAPTVDRVVLPLEAGPLLARLKARAACAFRGQQGRRATPEAEAAALLVPGGEHFLSCMFGRLRARFAEPRLNGRALRHSFVSAALAATGDLAAARDMARHRNVSTTGLYVHALQDPARAARGAMLATLNPSTVPHSRGAALHP